MAAGTFSRRPGGLISSVLAMTRPRRARRYVVGDRYGSVIEARKWDESRRQGAAAAGTQEREGRSSAGRPRQPLVHAHAYVRNYPGNRPAPLAARWHGLGPSLSRGDLGASRRRRKTGFPARGIPRHISQPEDSGLGGCVLNVVG